MSLVSRHLGQIAIAIAGTGLLATMMLTNPGYQRATRPFQQAVPAGETGQTRLIGGSFDDWRTASIILTGSARRDSQGVFLIAELTLSGTTTSTAIDAYWIGGSGRRYAATTRIAGLPRRLQDVRLQPGLTSHTVAIFEIPPDEIPGGAVLLTLPRDPMLDGTLRLAPPDAPPRHVETESFGA